MKTLLISLLIFLPILAFGQNCTYVDSVYSTCKAKEMGRRDIRFGIKQIAEDELSNKYCLSESGDDVDIEIYYFGTPKTTIRVLGVEKTDMKTQVGIRMTYKGQVYEGIGESEVEVRAVMIELVEGSIPFNQTVVSSSIKKAAFYSGFFILLFYNFSCYGFSVLNKSYKIKSLSVWRKIYFFFLCFGSSRINQIT
jgi:hypothetical protein